MQWNLCLMVLNCFHISEQLAISRYPRSGPPPHSVKKWNNVSPKSVLTVIVSVGAKERVQPAAFRRTWSSDWRRAEGLAMWDQHLILPLHPLLVIAFGKSSASYIFFYLTFWSPPPAPALHLLFHVPANTSDSVVCPVSQKTNICPAMSTDLSRSVGEITGSSEAIAPCDVTDWSPSGGAQLRFKHTITPAAEAEHGGDILCMCCIWWSLKTYLHRNM